MTIDLDGLIPATVLPMTDGGVIDEAALRRYIRWVARQGPVALAINVDTGEGPHLTHAEKVRVLQIVADETDLPIVAGVAGPFQAQAVAQARDYREAGASALLVFPIPAYLSAPLDPSDPRRVPPRDRRRRAAADRLPAPADARRRELRGRHAAAADRARRRGRDEGGVVRRPPLRRHVPDGPGDAEVPGGRVHLPDRERQLHPRVVHARLHRRADRLRGDHGRRAGGDDRGLARRAASTRRARSASACSGWPTWSSTRRWPTTARG